MSVLSFCEKGSYLGDGLNSSWCSSGQVTGGVLSLQQTKERRIGGSRKKFCSKVRAEEVVRFDLLSVALSLTACNSSVSTKWMGLTAHCLMIGFFRNAEIRSPSSYNISFWLICYLPAPPCQACTGCLHDSHAPSLSCLSAHSLVMCLRRMYEFDLVTNTIGPHICPSVTSKGLQSNHGYWSRFSTPSLHPVTFNAFQNYCHVSNTKLVKSLTMFPFLRVCSLWLYITTTTVYVIFYNVYKKCHLANASILYSIWWRVKWSCVAQLEKHESCNARIVGLILVGARHKTNVCIHDCKSNILLWKKKILSWRINMDLFKGK